MSRLRFNGSWQLLRRLGIHRHAAFIQLRWFQQFGGFNAAIIWLQRLLLRKAGRRGLLLLHEDVLLTVDSDDLLVAG